MPKSVVVILLLLFSPLLTSQNIDSLKQVIAASSEAEAKTSAYNVLLNHYRRNDSVLFKVELKKALEYARALNDRELEIDFAFINCKRLYSAGAYKTLIKEADSLQTIASANKFLEQHATMLNYKGNAYSNLSDYPNAAVQFIEFLSVATQMEDNTRLVAMANNNIGMAFLNMDRYDQAIPYLNKSLDGQENFESGFKAHTYWNLGICYMEQEQFEEALETYKLGVAEANRKNDRYAAAGNQLGIGSVYVRQDKFEEGIKAYSLAWEMSRAARLEPYKLIEALNGLIYAHNQLSRPEEAREYVALADSISEHHDLSDIRNREFLFYKSANLLQLGKPQEADIIFKRYEIAVDSVQNEKNLEIIQEKETEFRTKEKEQQLELQESQLNFQRLLNGILGVGALLFVIIGILVYRQQRLKIKHQQQEQALNEALLTVETNKKLENQRQRIAKELHDNIGSQLTYLASAAQNIGTGMKKTGPEVTEKKLKELSEFSQEAITDLRDTIWVMNRSSISWSDLAERIRYLAHKVSNTTGIKLNLIMEGDDTEILNATQTMNIYRIIQEAVNNAVKHSGGDTIEVYIKTNPPATISITDNGKGFDPTELTSSSDGLRNMRSRANKLGADLKIKTDEKGTQVILKFDS